MVGSIMVSGVVMPSAFFHGAIASTPPTLPTADPEYTEPLGYIL